MKIGIRAEDKSEWERRTPLTPKDMAALRADGLPVVVQESPQRAFKDEEYAQAGIPLQADLSDCDVIIGLKEIPSDLLEPDKTYVFFSHVIKGQPYNMPMLKQMMALGDTLIDYERIVDDQGRRLIAFGQYAGLAGMINGLWALGQRLDVEGIANPFSRLRQARTYATLSDAKEAIAQVGEDIMAQGIPPSVHPLMVGFAGYGNVSQGAQEIFDLLPFEEIAPGTVTKMAASPPDRTDRLYKVVYQEKDLVRPRDTEITFSLEDYYQYGKQKYTGAVGRDLGELTLLVNGIYWDERYPRLLNQADCRALWADGRKPRLRVVADISCDVDGALACTVEPSYPDRPLYVFHPDSSQVTEGVQGHGPVVMAVEILPAELPRESSVYFSRLLKDYVSAFPNPNHPSDFDQLDLPPEIKRAIILWQGRLTPAYRYLETHLKASATPRKRETTDEPGIPRH
jgi:alpha-aminoadipic semialdehyde synthase